MTTEELICEWTLKIILLKQIIIQLMNKSDLSYQSLSVYQLIWNNLNIMQTVV